MKQELIEAIKATIVPNDEKAITAESLANLLTEMVEAMGEGGGGVSFVIRAEEDEEGNVISGSTVEDIAHNKSQIEVLKQLKASGKPLPPIAINLFDRYFSESFGKDACVQYGGAAVSWGGMPDDTAPEGVIYPIIFSEFPLFVNGDGNVLPLE